MRDGDPLHRREEILEDIARTKVDLRVDLHAGDNETLPVRHDCRLAIKC